MIGALHYRVPLSPIRSKLGLVESYDAAKGRYRLLVMKERTKGARLACCKLQFAAEQEQREHEKTRRAQIEASVKAAIALREPEPEPEWQLINLP